MNGWIDSANGWSEHWAPILWRASWQGGLFIAAVWVVCKAFPRMPAARRHWLWWLASAQLLVRLVIPTPIALPLLPAGQSVVPPTVASQDSAPETFVSQARPATRRSLTVNRTYTGAEARGIAIVTSSPVVPASEPRPGVPLVLMSVWLIGLTVCVGRMFKRLVKARSYLHGRSLFDDGELTDLVEELSGRVGVRAPGVRESRKAPCPLLVGWIRPTIVLPTGASEALSRAELKMAVAHELVHLKRHDLWLSLALDAAQVLFFFHPLAWLAIHETAAAREEACDSETLRLSGASHAAYARLLFNSARSSSSAAVMGAAIGYRLIQRRINMLKSSTPADGPIIRRILTGAIALAAVCALPWTVTAQSPTSPTPKKTHARKALKKHAKVVAKHSAKKSAVAVASSRKTPVRAVVIATSRPAESVRYFANAQPTQARPVKTPVVAMPSVAASTGYATMTTPALTTTSARSSTSVGITRPARTTFRPSPTSAASVSTSATVLAYPTPSVASVSASDGPHVTVDNGKVSVEFEKANLREAIKALCEKAKLDYTLRSDIADDTVTVSIHNADPMQILSAILKAVKQPLTYRVESDVVQIFPKTDN